MSRDDLIKRLRNGCGDEDVAAAADMLERDAQVIAGLTIELENQRKNVALYERMLEAKVKKRKHS